MNDGGSSPRLKGRARRHCMVVYAYYPLGETRVQREAEALVEAGFEVDVVCLRRRGEPAVERSGAIEIHRLPMRLRKGTLITQFASYLEFFVLAFGRVSALQRRRPYDSLQVHNLPDFLVFCALVPKMRGVPVILDLHDLMPEFFAGRFGTHHRFVPQLVRWQERLSCAFADHVITVSDHWRRALVERGVPSSKVSCVMNVADRRIFAPLASSRPDRDGFRLLYHGTLHQRYGLDLAIRAVATVRHEIPDIVLTIVGMGDATPALRRLSRDLDVEGNVEIREGFLPAEELPQLISGADVGIVPYRNDVFTDGLLPTKLMEYAEMGLPSIASRTSAIEEYFSGSLVEFFDPGDPADLARAIRELYSDPGRRAELARRAGTFTTRYNWTEIGAAYVTLVQQLAEGRRRRLPSD
jgi:glycosyltransferase involved in cell wall biosynthesis